MRAPAYWRFLLVALLAGVFFFGLSGQRAAHAGGPLLVGGAPQGFGPDAQPFTWDTTTEIQYTTDGGNLGTLDNNTANARVQVMFQVWEDVATATIGFNRFGPITGVADNDVSTMAEFNTVEGDCKNGNQSPIVYDADGSLFDDLVGDPNVIGFAGPCRLDVGGRILSARAALNGKFQDGVGPAPGDPELSANAFDATFIHEFGHFSGLDHSQINLNCLVTGCADLSDDAFGLPTMFPILISSLEESSGIPAQFTLAPDDIAWISRLYPGSTFTTAFGTIEGTVLFSDGQTPAQGVNVIARQVGNPRRVAVSVVSGYLFTSNPGQSVTGTNPGSSLGSLTPTLVGFYRIPGLVPGNYTVEVESINAGFDAGSGVGPLNPPIPMPGTAPSPAGPFVVSAGGTVTGGTNITLVGTPPRFDQFER